MSYDQAKYNVLGSIEGEAAAAEDVVVAEVVVTYDYVK